METREYKSVTQEELQWLDQYNKDVAKDEAIECDPNAGDFYGCWPSCRSREDWTKASEITMRMIDENLSHLKG